MSTSRTYGRRGFLLGMAALLGAGRAAAASDATEAPNVVPIDAHLVTSGQPSAKGLRTLRDRGFEAVIYLAPGTVQDAVAEEPAILEAQGIEFVHIPIPFNAPDESHFVAVAEALRRLRERKVLVHCQVNLRASSMVFLYRAIVEKQDPARAYEAVARVWSPEGPWKSLIATELRKNGVAFEPY
jgi:protein tyrosine phosphatase (PTP) superfamily phosphohydrolase (DUF442 family)